MYSQLSKAVDFFKELFFNHIDNNAYCWISGGAVRDYFLYGGIANETDIDVFFYDQSNYKKIVDLLQRKKFKCVYENKNSAKWQHESGSGFCYDLVKIFYKSPKQAIQSFDFTICCCAIDKVGIYHHETFFIDLASKSLIINDLKKPDNTISRLRKYIVKGFHIDNGELAKIIKAVRQMPESKFSDFMKEESDSIYNNDSLVLNPTPTYPELNVTRPELNITMGGGRSQYTNSHPPRPNSTSFLINRASQTISSPEDEIARLEEIFEDEDITV